MSKFEDYEKVVSDPLILPIRGKEYRIPEAGAADGIKYRVYAEKVAAALEAQKTDPTVPTPAPEASDDEYFHMFLGAAYDEMVADNVPYPAIKLAFTTAIADFQLGRGAAEIMWATGGDPKAVKKYLTPNRASRRASQPSTGTGSAKKTPSRASTSSTKTSPTSL